MICKATRPNNRICTRYVFREEQYCYIHIRKWLQERLKKFGEEQKFPRKKEEIKEGIKKLMYIDPEYQNTFEYNIIHIGVFESNNEHILQGIKLGININKKTKQGQLAPIHMLRKINRKILKNLITAGAEINAKCKQGNTILYYSLITYGAEKEQIRLLLENGADATGFSNLAKWMQQAQTQKGCINLVTIKDKWHEENCVKWRQGILDRFVKKLPNIANRNALFDALYDYFELAHILCIQNV